MAAKSTLSTRPETHTERSACIDFAAPLLEVGSPFTVIAATLIEEYGPAADVYIAARVANEAAATDVENASAQVHACSAAFDTSLVAWTLTIDAINSTRGFAEAELRAEIGHQTISAFLKDPGRVKVDQMITLFVHVGKVPALTGDPARFEALRVATTALRVAVTAHEATLRVRAHTVAVLTKASDVFDTWGGPPPGESRHGEDPHQGDLGPPRQGHPALRSQRARDRPPEVPPPPPTRRCGRFATAIRAATPPAGSRRSAPTRARTAAPP